MIFIDVYRDKPLFFPFVDNVRILTFARGTDPAFQLLRCLDAQLHLLWQAKWEHTPYSGSKLTAFDTGRQPTLVMGNAALDGKESGDPQGNPFIPL